MNDITPIKQLVFTEISEGDSKLFFNPPLEIDYWIISEKDNLAKVSFDFGLGVEINYNSWLNKNCQTVDEKIINLIEFELFHAFMHYNGDPNYSTVNWALFGNLFFRVKCLEDYGEYGKEIWTYEIQNNKLARIQHEI